ncbi:MAG: hypothetical protein ACFCD0_26720 [Gemmataceae bacterium]
MVQFSIQKIGLSIGVVVLGFVVPLAVASDPSEVSLTRPSAPKLPLPGQEKEKPAQEQPKAKPKTDIGALLKKAGISFRRAPNKQYIVQVNVKETGDKHFVFVSPGAVNISGFEFFRLSSPAKLGYQKAEAKWMSDLLDRNRTTLFGAWEVQKLRDKFIPSYTSQVPVKATPLALKAALLLTVREAYAYQGVPSLNWYERRIHLKGPKGAERKLLLKADRVVAKVGKFNVHVTKTTVTMGAQTEKIRGRVTIMIIQHEEGPPTITVNRKRVFTSDL